jgi:hypothetical protein
MKKTKCILIFHGVSREINMGEFESKAAAKRYASECWSRPYSIIPIKQTIKKETEAAL